jgi:hypothetical protein
VAKARNTRRAVVLLDRIARDLESAYLVRKPGPLDPLQHPWLFLADSDEPSLGAQRLKFSSRGRRPHSPQAVESDVEMVAWQLAPTDGRDFELVRWSSPRLPAGRDLSFPAVADSDLVARGIAQFGVQLTGEDGQPVARWDSSAITDSSELPIAAVIQVSFYPDEDSDAVDGPYTRRVEFPLRPIDVEAQLEAAGAGAAGAVDANGDGIPDNQQDSDGDGIPDSEDDETASEEEPGMTVAECAALHPDLFQAAMQMPGVKEVYESLASQPWKDVAPALQGVGFPAPADCK